MHYINGGIDISYSVMNLIRVNSMRYFGNYQSLLENKKNLDLCIAKL